MGQKKMAEDSEPVSRKSSQRSGSTNAIRWPLSASRFRPLAGSGKKLVMDGRPLKAGRIAKIKEEKAKLQCKN